MAVKGSKCDSCKEKSENCEETCSRPDFSFAPRNDIKSVIAVMSGSVTL